MEDGASTRPLPPTDHRVLQNQQELPEQPQFIQLTGGETFLRDDLPEIAQAVHSTAPRCMMWFPTNGLLPDKVTKVAKEILDTLDNPRIGITISLDGEGVMHDIQRGLDGSYKKAIETLRNLSEQRKSRDFFPLNRVYLDLRQLQACPHNPEDRLPVWC